MARWRAAVAVVGSPDVHWDARLRERRRLPVSCWRGAPMDRLKLM